VGDCEKGLSRAGPISVRLNCRAQIFAACKCSSSFMMIIRRPPRASTHGAARPVLISRARPCPPAIDVGTLPSELPPAYVAGTPSQRDDKRIHRPLSKYPQLGTGQKKTGSAPVFLRHMSVAGGIKKISLQIKGFGCGDVQPELEAGKRYRIR
jgi:hypothetical protein